MARNKANDRKPKGSNCLNMAPEMMQHNTVEG